MAEPPDDLARTATAAAGAGGAAPALGAMLGRYRLERMLGEGGMGVVHAAFDPDLERRVALKVLRTADGGDLARQRLLREARAMARLTHINVVTVHEVGSAAGRDYVAMELVEGETLDQWLRAGKRTPEAIVEAFVAAGRGLAAAHAAELVHRDFKPHNVLRRRDGRIAVTDFGLARGVDAPTALARTIDLQAATPAVTPGSLAELTATGSVLGTPAYMAPEQWTGGPVGPPADQFAFCVAAWEALTGERPFRGATLDALKAEVQRGPAELDASKLPRRLRAALRRGLDPEPGKRWPSMDALLAALGPERRGPIAAYAGVAVVIAGLAAYAVLAGRAPAAVCAAPALDPAAVWPASEAAALRAAGRGEIADALGRDVADWSAARDRACRAPNERRVAELACLDGALARLEAVHRAVGKVAGELSGDAVTARLVAPSTCEAASPPRLVVTPTADVVTALGFALDAGREGSQLVAADVAAFARAPDHEPCARSLALGAVADLLEPRDIPTARTARGDAVTAAEQCGDERMRADTLLAIAPYEFEVPVIGPHGEAAIVKANTAVSRVAQPDLVAEIDLMRGRVAASQRRWTEAFSLGDKAIDEYGQRHRTSGQLAAVRRAIDLRSERSHREDITAARALVAQWLPVAERVHDAKTADSLARSDAFCRWFLGDTDAQRDMMKHWRNRPIAGMPTQRVDGVVLGRDGKPAAGAMVIAGQLVFLDSHGLLPLPGLDRLMRIATTDSDGKFSIPDATMSGAIVAQLDGLRSAAEPLAAEVKLALAPVRTISGTADLGTRERTTSFVMLQPSGKLHAYRVMAPIGEDGRFAIGGAPTSAVQIGIATREGNDLGSLDMVGVPASPTDTAGIKLALTTSDRVIDMIARSSTAQALDTAQVFVFSGHRKLTSADELTTDQGAVKIQFARPLVGEAMPNPLIDKLRAGDLVSHFTHVPPGDVTACAIGLNGDLHDPKFASQLQSHLHGLALKCAWLGPADTTVVIEAPPQKRFD